MAETPTKPKTPVKARRTRSEADASKPVCHIHDKVEEWEIEEIRSDVCVTDIDLILHEDGHHYCVFHLPSAEKTELFGTRFTERLDKIEERIAATETLPENEREKAIGLIKYDFRYIWFPSSVAFRGYEFAAYADFRLATFTASSYFRSATFTADADFSEATFTASANFRSATFTADADFSEATFTADAYFRSATFTADANFSSATFTAYVSFSSATFSAYADFSSVKILETAKLGFGATRFFKIVTFEEGSIEGFIEFEGEVFLTEESVAALKAETGNATINERPEAFLSLAGVRLSKPDRISFNSTKLRPCWFVNAEVRGLNFNDVEWQDLEIDIDRTGLDREFQELISWDIPRPKESLIKACNQLADNAEANRRFEEARLFRKQAIALRERKCHIHDGVDSDRKDGIRKEVCRHYPVVNEDGGNYYCLLHNPEKSKAEIFRQEFEKLRDAGHSDYRGVNFPISVNFYVPPEEMNFSYAVFHRRVLFHEASITDLTFYEAHFGEDAELAFEYSTCSGSISFEKAVFEGKFFLNGSAEHTFFNQPDHALDLNDTRFENPEGVNFRSVRLQPHYFVGVDAGKFVFHDCRWGDNGEKDPDVDDELKLCSNTQLTEAANRIAINYEENRNFETSSVFRYMAMDAKRYSHRLNGWFFTLDWLYWLSSGYGERRLRAAVNLILVLVLFAVLFASPLSSFDYGEKADTGPVAVDNKGIHQMDPGEAMVHSGLVAAFQRPDPKPYGTPTKLFVFLESIFAPLQAALLALAIRRKFMR